MIAIHGQWYDGKRSTRIPLVLKVFDNGSVQGEQAETGEILFRHGQCFAKVSHRLGDTPRFLTFPHGAILETEDHDAVDALLVQTGRFHWMRWVHLLETRKRFLLAAGLLVLLLAGGLVKFGFPLAAKIISAHLPRSVFESADRQVLKALDHLVFKPSELADDLEDHVRAHLGMALKEHARFDIKLLFRKGGRLGPNAFALPGGAILFTDELVLLAEHDDEILAILVHEIGHVVHQHGMRRIVQDSLLSFAILSLTGDASGVSELFLGLPVLLTELAYSRDFEREADRYALSYLKTHGIDPARFADILQRMDQGARDQGPGEQNEPWTGYLATHPPTADRIKAFREADPK
jgi:Zn-dependent protease with chaperone function